MLSCVQEIRGRTHYYRVMGAATINAAFALLLAWLFISFIDTSHPDNEGGLGIVLIWATISLPCIALTAILISPLIVHAIDESRQITVPKIIAIYLSGSSISVVLGGIVSFIIWALFLLLA